MGSITILVSSLIAKYNGPINVVIFAALVVTLYTVGANTLNDYFDYEIDKINRPDRAISYGLVLRTHALIISIFSVFPRDINRAPIKYKFTVGFYWYFFTSNYWI